jgi:hypothetical protein
MWRAVLTNKGDIGRADGIRVREQPEPDFSPDLAEIVLSYVLPEVGNDRGAEVPVRRRGRTHLNEPPADELVPVVVFRHAFQFVCRDGPRRLRHAALSIPHRILASSLRAPCQTSAGTIWRFAPSVISVRTRIVYAGSRRKVRNA